MIAARPHRMTSTHPRRIRWNLDDLELLPDNSNRYELIDGELLVTRASHWKHQDVLGKLYAALLAWSEASGLGRPILAPGLIFSREDAVIPDLVWASQACLERHIDAAGHLTSAPELVVEVLSLTVADQRRDRDLKLKLYSVQGVREYWIADRQEQTLEVYRRDQAVLVKALTLLASDELTSPLLPGFRCPIERLLA